MGLDQWLVAKTKVKLEESKPTGVCSGIFGITRVMDGEQELAYLRKGYDQSEIISYYCTPTETGDDCMIVKDDIPLLIEKVEDILREHEFDKDGYDISDDYDGLCSTWQSKTKWETLLDGLKKAKTITDEDPDAVIIYKEWA